MRPKLLLEDASDDLVDRVRRRRSTARGRSWWRRWRRSATAPTAPTRWRASPARCSSRVGEGDPFFPPEEAQQLAHAAPRRRFRAFAGARHLPNLEQPDEFNAVLTGFLADV